VDHPFAEPQLFKAGEGFRFQCDYNNTEDHALRFGTQARDEMCILFGLAWDAGNQREIPSQSCSLTWRDENNVAQDTKAKGGFPPPSAELANLCIQGGSNGAEPSECLSCQCNSCADVLVKCMTDKPCANIITCIQECGGGAECAGQCQAVIDENSSAVGLSQQVGGCVNSKCSETCSG
jgi:hypothetical protein